MIGTFFFIIQLLGMPSFGGDVTIAVAAHTQEGCYSLHRAAKVQLMQAGIRYTISDCRDDVGR